jgi:hypothetical protein
MVNKAGRGGNSGKLMGQIQRLGWGGVGYFPTGKQVLV